MKSNHVLASITLSLIVVLPSALAADSMELQHRHEVQRECERLVLTFLDLFENEHAKTADLFTEDGEAFSAVGRESIRESFSKIDAKKVEENVLISSNLLIRVSDEDNATGSGYVTHYQHRYPNSDREGQAECREPNTITKWSWEFKRVGGAWKISKVKPKTVMVRTDLVKYMTQESK